ncbi:hypothetical protein [Capnocytophaga gingivalis]
MTAIQTLKQWFSNFKKPTQEQFWAWLDSFWHKSEKIPMTSIEGLENVIQGTASAEQLRNHLTDSQAHKGLFDGKVDKVPGKILSSNDFTNELRTKLEGLRNVDISGLLPKGGYTGTAQNLKELIDNIMRILQSPDTELDELREIVAFIKQNKRTLDTLGINNIAGLQDALNGKAPTDHNHDDRYSRLGHTHSEYALRTHTHSEYAPKNHRHNWDDIEGKPEIVTKEKITEVVKNIKIGGRNYALNSKNKKNLVGYVGAYWKLSEPAVVGKTYTFSCYANVENGKRLTMYFSDIHGQPRQYIVPDLVNGYNQASVTPNYAWTELCAFHEVSGISPTPTATIEKLKFEIGDKATDWSPAPEDLENKYVVSLGNQTQLNNEHAGKVLDINTNISILDLSGLSGGIMISIIKTVQGAVTFSGKTIIGDNAITGGVGSTASIVISPGLSDRAFISVNNK